MELKKELLDILLTSESHLSGQELARKFSVSRTAIWKAVKKLREEGYSIDSVTNRGYLLKREADVILPALIERKTGIRTICFSSIPSTNEYAKKAELTSLPLIVIAQEQTKGKARFGETFSSPREKGVYFSLALDKKIPLEEIRPLSERAVKGVKETLGGEIRENTIVKNGKKRAGVLTEVECDTDYTERVVIGVGVYTEESEDKTALIFSLVRNLLKNL